MEELRPSRDAGRADASQKADHRDGSDFRGSRGVLIGQAGIQQNFFLDPATIERLLAATRSRPWLLPSAAVLLGAAAVGWTVAALVPSSAVSVVGAIGGGVCFLLSCICLAILVTAKTARVRQLSEHLLRFLAIQRESSMVHRYRFFEGHAPELSEILVQQRSQLQAGPTESEPEPPISVLSMLSRHEHVVLVGGAGSGKSTAAAFVTSQASDHLLDRTSSGRPPPVGEGVPLVVAAQELVDSSVPTAIRRTIAKNFGEELAGWLPDEFYEQRRWLLLIDGLDEIAGREERSRALHRLSKLLDTGSRNYRLVVLTRPLLYTELVSLQRRRVALYELLPFDAGEFAEFAQKWFTARSEGADRRTAGDAAQRFQQTITDAGLGHLVRIPLIATIAAMVYENDQGSRLPTGRAGLYEKLVSHYLYGRRPIEAVMRGVLPDIGAAADLSPPGLRAMLRHFLETVADEYLAKPVDADLTAIIETSWSGLHPGLRSAGAAPDWRDRLRTMVTSIGLVTSSGNSLQFVHRSLAEYLAAGTQAADFEEARWILQLRDPARRSLALFVLARLDPDSRAEVVQHLRDDVSRVIEAGHVLADGVPMSVDAQRAVVARLLDHLHSGQVLVVDCIRVLVQLSSRPEVRAHLEELCGDPAQPGWLRVQVAEKLHEVDRGSSNALLRDLVRESGLGEDVRSWAAARLAARGDSYGKLYADMRWDAVEWSSVLSTGTGTNSSELTREALVAILEDPDHKPSDRYNAALALVDGGDPRAIRTIITIGRDIAAPEALRRNAAEWLAENGHQAAAETCLRSILEDTVLSFGGRFAVLVELAGLGASIPLDVVEQLASSPQLAPDGARWILQHLTDSGSTGEAAVPCLDALATNPALDDHVRLSAAWRRAEFDPTADLQEFLVALIHDVTSPPDYAEEAIEVLVGGAAATAAEYLAAVVKDQHLPARRREFAYLKLSEESADRALLLADELTRAHDPLPMDLHAAVLALAARRYGQGGRAVIDRELADPGRGNQQRAVGVIVDTIAEEGLPNLVPFIEDASKPLLSRSVALAGLTARWGGAMSSALRPLLLSEKLDIQLLLQVLDNAPILSPHRWQLLCDVYRARPDARLLLLDDILRTARRYSADVTTDLILEVFFNSGFFSHHRGVALRRILDRNDHVAPECVLHLLENEVDKSYGVLREAMSARLRKVLTKIAEDESASPLARLRAARQLPGVPGSEMLVALALRSETPWWSREAALHALLTRADFDRVCTLVEGLRENTRPDAEALGILDAIEAHLRVGRARPGEESIPRPPQIDHDSTAD